MLIALLLPLAAAFGMARSVRRLRMPLHKHPTRREILEILKRRPGTNTTGLCTAANVKWGTMQHHLGVLERGRVIRSVVEGRDRLFFLNDGPREGQNAVAVLRRGRVMEVVRSVMKQPGIVQKHLTSKVEISRKVLRDYVILLTHAGLLREYRENQVRRYFPTTALAALLQDMATEDAPHPEPAELPPGSTEAEGAPGY